ncbi:MAG: hypothetical protein ABI877_03085, partial [Gemmatimonadaceae bacterium]
MADMADMADMGAATGHEAARTEIRRSFRIAALAGVRAAINTDRWQYVKRTARRQSTGGTMLNLKVMSWSLGIFAAISFVLCVIYG